MSFIWQGLFLWIIILTDENIENAFSACCKKARLFLFQETHNPSWGCVTLMEQSGQPQGIAPTNRP
jgi:hypothetical protein